MRRRAPAAGLLLVAGLGGSAAARAPATDLHVRAAPARTPESLAMRAEDPAGPAPAAAPAPATPGPARPSSLFDRFAALPADLDELSDRVVFHFQLGQELTQGQTLDGFAPASGDPQAGRNTRFFTVGNFAVGSRGLLLKPLSSYLAGQFRFDQSGRVDAITSLPTAYDPADQGGAVLIRSAYAELGGLGGVLRPLRLRAGRQYRYGLAVAHFDGLTAAWETSRASLTVFFGQRSSLYRDDLFLVGTANLDGGELPASGLGVIGGAQGEVRILRVGEAPILVGGELFSFDGRDASQATARFQATREITVLTFVRGLDGGLARLGVNLAARLSRTATLTIDVEHRRKDDWIYDFVAARPAASDDPGRTRHLRLHLDAEVEPELFVSVRGGTVLFDNLDVLLSAAAGVPTSAEGEPSPWAPAWVEAGAAVDGRLRNNTSVALSGRTRLYLRAEDSLPMSATLLSPLEVLPSTGETSLTDGALRVRYALGRKRFAAEAAVFVRFQTTTVFVSEERPGGLPDLHGPETEAETDGGARFYVEAWLGPRARLVAEYEVTSTPERFTELRGLQALRLLGEVSF